MTAADRILWLMAVVGMSTIIGFIFCFNFVAAYFTLEKLHNHHSIVGVIS